MNSILVTNSGINRYSGGGVVGWNLYQTLKKYTNLVAVLGMNADEEVKPFESINPANYKQQFSPFLIDYFALMRLMQLKAMTEIDLALFYAAPFGMTARWLKQNPDIKIIVDLAPHDIEESKKEHEKFFGAYPFPHLTDETLWMLYTEHLRLANVVITHSHISADYIKRKAKLDVEPIVIPHGCYLPEKIEYPEKFTVGAMNVAGIDKGLIYALTAWKKLQPKISWFYVAGAGTEQWIPPIERMKIPNVKVFGWVKDVSEFYNKISVLVAPSITEGFGICVLEAMAHGKPVIVSKGAGVSEFVEDGKEGFVVPVRDVDAIANKIAYFRGNPDEIRKMGQNARKKAEKYTWDKIIEEYGKVIKNVE